MLDELRKNASSDKEFVQMEMQKRIKDLEQQIIQLKEEHASEKEALMEEQRKAASQYETRLE